MKACNLTMTFDALREKLGLPDTVKITFVGNYINNFEVSCGNRCISQWLAAQANLTILETFLQQRAA